MLRELHKYTEMLQLPFSLETPKLQHAAQLKVINYSIFENCMRGCVFLHILSEQRVGRRHEVMQAA